jgi:hypothetical protein
MAEKTTPDFVAIDSLRPGTQNLNLVVKVRHLGTCPLKNETILP